MQNININLATLIQQEKILLNQLRELQERCAIARKRAAAILENLVSLKSKNILKDKFRWQRLEQEGKKLNRLFLEKCDQISAVQETRINLE